MNPSRFIDLRQVVVVSYPHRITGGRCPQAELRDPVLVGRDETAKQNSTGGPVSDCQ